MPDSRASSLLQTCLHDAPATWLAKPWPAVPLIKEAIANGELFRAHAFEYACARNDIDHRTTRARHRDRAGRRTRRGGASGCRGGPARVRGRTFFERPAMAAKPGAQGAAADPQRPLGQESSHHLVQRDVLALIDQPDNEGFMRIEAGSAASALPSRHQLADLRPGYPADRARYTHSEPGRGWPRRHAIVRSLQHPRR
jgi:hypothetical protein